MAIKLNKSNPNYKAIQEAVKRNNGFCPCRLQKTEENKCICKEFREQLEGVCHCGLYVKE